MLENPIELDVTKHAKATGWLVRKLRWIGRRGAPDRFFAKNGFIVFIEFKAPGKKPNAQQKREHRRLRLFGVRVWVIDSVEEGCRRLDAAA